jgi:hypothetical protein
MEEKTGRRLIPTSLPYLRLQSPYLGAGSHAYSRFITLSDYSVSVHKLNYSVIPAKAGIQKGLKLLDSRLHGNDILSHL